MYCIQKYMYDESNILFIGVAKIFNTFYDLQI